MNKKILIRISAIVLCVITMVLIFYFSADTAPESEKKSDGLTSKIVHTIDPSVDEKADNRTLRLYEVIGAVVRKTAHFSEFAALGFFASIAVNTIYLDLKRRITIPFLFGAVYAISDEVHQLFVPGRAGLFTDILIDTLGVAAGVAVSIGIFAIFEKKRAKNSKNNIDFDKT